MPQIDFSKIPNMEDYTPLPPGKYLARLDEIEETKTKDEAEMWKLKFTVVSGAAEGRKIFDQMVFSEKAFKRVKLICSRLGGINTDANINLTPDMLKGQSVVLEVVIESYADENGVEKKRNKVTFAGYEKADGTGAGSAAGASAPGDDIPF